MPTKIHPTCKFAYLPVAVVPKSLFVHVTPTKIKFARKTIKSNAQDKYAATITFCQHTVVTKERPTAVKLSCIFSALQFPSLQSYSTGFNRNYLQTLLHRAGHRGPGPRHFTYLTLTLIGETQRATTEQPAIVKVRVVVDCKFVVFILIPIESCECDLRRPCRVKSENRTHIQCVETKDS